MVTSSPSGQQPTVIEWQFIGTLAERNSPGPTLRTAIQRIPPAMQKIEALRPIVEHVFRALEERPVHFVLPRADLNAGRFDRAQPSGPELPTQMLVEARLLASETIHHLRTALEYLAYQLIWLDSGDPFEDSAFPMCAKPRYWRKARSSRLLGLSDHHADQIEQLQPFNCDWTAQLKELSNADKHRNVFRLGQLIQGEDLTLSTDHGTAHPEDPSLWILTPRGQRATLQFEDGADAVEALVRLAGHTARTLLEFQPEFGERLGMSITWNGETLS